MREKIWYSIGVLLAWMLFLTPSRSVAQEAPADSVKPPAWKTDLISKLAATQAGYRNWSKGGVSTLAITGGLEGQTRNDTGPWQQKHDMRLAFGLVKQDTLEFRKADDVIHLNSSLEYRGSGFFDKINPTIASQIRTQFAPGFNYKKNPFEGDDRRPPIKVSDFLSPVTLNQSLGLTYDPTKWFNYRLGVGVKETVVLIERFRPLYGLRLNQPVQWEWGLESRTNLDREIFENVRLKSSLGLFAAFNNTPDLMWENLVAMKINSWLGVNLQFDTLYDRDYDTRVQMKEVLSLGLSFELI